MLKISHCRTLARQLVNRLLPAIKLAPHLPRLPSRCLLCGAQACALLCTPCETELPYNQQPCPRCALPDCHFSDCPECLAKPPPFEKSVAAFCYQAPLAGLINRWKHGGDQRLLPYLRPQLLRHLQRSYGQDDWPERLITVPIPRRRRIQRGFNQTEQLAQMLGRALQIPCLHTALSRTAGHSQQGLDRRQRLQNLQRQFQLNTAIDHQHVAIVDDVMTTGATAATLAKILKDAGVKRVDIWMIARTP